jgi:nucleoside-diphosphate kinase
MIKPDGVQRGMVGEIVNRFERKGFKIVGAKFMQVSQELAEAHYSQHSERPFFGELVNFITSSPVFAMVLEGDNIIAAARVMMGATNPVEASPGTMRGDLAVSIGMNMIHGSDSSESADREINLWFDAKELTSYDLANGKWV